MKNRCAHPKRERLWLDGERCWCSRCGALKLATWHYPTSRRPDEREAAQATKRKATRDDAVKLGA